MCLYEGLTGNRAFEGHDALSTLAAVLRDDVDFSRLPADTGPAVRRLLERCPVRDRRNRLQHIGDARLELEVSTRADAETSSPRPEADRWRSRIWVLLTHISSRRTLGRLGDPIQQSSSD